MDRWGQISKHCVNIIIPLHETESSISQRRWRKKTPPHNSKWQHLLKRTELSLFVPRHEGVYLTKKKETFCPSINRIATLIATFLKPTLAPTSHGNRPGMQRCESIDAASLPRSSRDVYCPITRKQRARLRIRDWDMNCYPHLCPSIVSQRVVTESAREKIKAETQARPTLTYTFLCRHVEALIEKKIQIIR